MNTWINVSSNTACVCRLTHANINKIGKDSLSIQLTLLKVVQNS